MRSNLVSLLGLVAIAYSPFLAFRGLSMLNPAQTFNNPLLAGWLGVLIGFASFIFLQAIVVLFSLQALRGERPDIKTSLVVGLRRFPVALAAAIPPALLTSLLEGTATALWDYPTIGLVLGGVALIVSVYVTLAVWVVVPEAVVERNGVFGALRVSFALTKRHLVDLFLIQLVVGGLPLLILVVCQQMLSLSGNLAVLVQLALLGAMSAIAGPLITVCYHDLRMEKGDTGVGSWSGNSA